MARPPRKEEASRKIVYVRMSPAEIERVDADRREAGLSRSEYVRRRALGRRVEPSPVSDAQTATELGRIGNNLNQLARALNAAEKAGTLTIDEDTAREIADHASQVERLADDVRTRIVGGGRNADR